MKQRCDDDGAFSTGSRIRMAALCPGDDTVGTDNDVDVEFRINFESTEDDKVQFIDVSTFVEGVSILARRDFVMVRVGLMSSMAAVSKSCVSAILPMRPSCWSSQIG